jgi:hypothetical protein
MGIVRIHCLDFKAPAQNANKKIIQLTLQCLRETRRGYSVDLVQGRMLLDRDKPGTGIRSF